jgi:hypothetical protein
MASPSTSKLGSKFRWWHMPLIPFVFAGTLGGLLGFLVMLAIAAPFAMISGRLKKRRIDRKLRTDGRRINWSDAIAERNRDGKEIIVELGPNKFGAAWLVTLPGESQGALHAYPTYAMWETDPRATYEACNEIDQTVIPQLLPYMNTAKRIDNSPCTMSEMGIETKEFIRIMPASPTRLLLAAIRNEING